MSQQWEQYLAGQFLAAMPGMRDPRFQRTVIYMCAHSSDGAMGIIINRLVGAINLQDLLDQLNLQPKSRESTDVRVHYGGPVESSRGFVLHSSDFSWEDSLHVSSEVTLTASVDILRMMASGQGPSNRLLALGYAGWGPGQLDNEINRNDWLNVPADIDMLFDKDLDDKWERAIGILGVSVAHLSAEAGRT